jgi:hypothetical protein
VEHPPQFIYEALGGAGQRRRSASYLRKYLICLLKLPGARPSSPDALPMDVSFCIFGGLLSAYVNPRARLEVRLPTAGKARVTAGSPQETATRQGWTSVEVPAVQIALQ